MFRNVIGVQEAVVHRQSEDSLTHETNHIKFIKDIQSDNIAQSYSTLKTQWFHQREQFIEYLKTLGKSKKDLKEFKRVQSLIDCLNELIDNGEVTKNCQLLINEMNKTIQPFPQTDFLTKPLGDRSIRLPRHHSNSVQIIHLQQSNERIKPQIDPQLNDKHVDETSDTDETVTSNEKMKTGIQFYFVAEQFRNYPEKKSGKKHYISPSIIE